MKVRDIIGTMFVFAGVFFSAATILAEGWEVENQYMPTAAHYQAAESGANCSIFRSIQSQSQLKINQNQELMKTHLKDLKEARAELDKCATDKGVSSINGGEQEVLIAELCPSLYRSWLQPSYKVRMVAADLKEAYQTSRVMGSQLRQFCSDLPALPEPEVEAGVGERQASVGDEEEAFQDDEDLPVDASDADDLYPEDDGYEFVEIAKKGGELGGF